jgi:hypothetical protein
MKCRAQEEDGDLREGRVMLSLFFALVIPVALALTIGACVAPGSQSAAQPNPTEIR